MTEGKRTLERLSRITLYKQETNSGLRKEHRASKTSTQDHPHTKVPYSVSTILTYLVGLIFCEPRNICAFNSPDSATSHFQQNCLNCIFQNVSKKNGYDLSLKKKRRQAKTSSIYMYLNLVNKDLTLKIMKVLILYLVLKSDIYSKPPEYITTDFL